MIPQCGGCCVGFWRRKRSGRYPKEAADGAEAVEKAQRFAPDLAILDLVMPGMNGLQAAQVISSQNPGALMLLITVQHLSQQHLDAARSAGFRGAVTKDRGQEILKAAEAVLNNELYFHLEEYTSVG